MTRRLPWVATLLGVLEILIALSAFAGGIGLIGAPDGSAVGLPLEILENSPFGDFLIPGLILFFVVGGSMLTGGIAVLLRWKWAVELSLGAGVVLLGWITIQALIIQQLSWLHYLYWSLALITIGLAASLRRARYRQGNQGGLAG